jgi:hypothetical protein
MPKSSNKRKTEKRRPPDQQILEDDIENDGKAENFAFKCEKTLKYVNDGVKAWKYQHLTRIHVLCSLANTKQNLTKEREFRSPTRRRKGLQNGKLHIAD